MKMKKRWIIVWLLALTLGIFTYTNRQILFGSDTMADHEMGIDRYLVEGRFEKYSAEKLSQAKNKTVVLFFNASWCPSCSLFSEEMHELSKTLPDGILILAVDYDDNFDLRKKYTVAYQHTFVVVDENGAVKHKWSGGGVSRLKKELNLSEPLNPLTP